MINGQTDPGLEVAQSTNGHASGQFSEPSIPAWWSVIERYSRLLVAVVNLQNHRIEWTSDRFRKLVGMVDAPPTLGDTVLQRLDPEDQRWVRERIRRHVLQAILSAHYERTDLIPSRWLHEPLILSVKPLEGDRARFVEFNISSDHIRILSLDPVIEKALADCWSGTPDTPMVMQQLNDRDAPLQRVWQLLNPETYQASGTILLEGMDVTDREVTQRLIHLLLARESILQPHRFQQANHLLRRLFRATDSLILTAEEDAATLYLGLESTDWTIHTLPVYTLKDSPLFQAARRGTVLNLRDVTNHCHSKCELLLRDRGVRSLLVLPLVVKSARLKTSSRLLGLVAVMSQQPDVFDAIDEHYATTLAPALTIAMRHTVNERFTHIHESVRWRFEEEAERRSLGLPAEPIIFGDVYPLYGISDIRGSSHERNRAIQKDLLEQFHLGLAIVEAVCIATNDNAFATQFQTDLLDHIAELRASVTVDAEVTLLRYLQKNLEAHFGFFRTCSEDAAAAIAAYEAAKDPEQNCVYTARALYDQNIQNINQSLRDTWHRWQRTMQSVTRHYCDIEATDGIDHMLYAGAAIDGTFTDFHLRSLRYEQLRAVCDCARTGFRLRDEHQTELRITHLVLVQDSTVDITHDENTERLFEVRGTRDTRYEIVKKRIDKAVDSRTQERITQPGCLTLVYSTNEEWKEYQEYVRYLQREGWVGSDIEQGSVEPLQGVTGLKFARVQVLESENSHDSEG
ncbi:MAG: GAF domain-containing protein [Cyanobacteria bacterium P01_F01_bin.86]